MKKLSLLLLFSFIHLVPINIQPYEFFDIKKQQQLPSEIKNIIAQKSINLNGQWYPDKIYQHKSNVNYVTFNQAGTRILTSSDDNTATLCNFKGEKRTTFNHQDWVNTAVFHPIKNLVLTATTTNDYTAILWKEYKPTINWVLEQVLLRKVLNLYVETSKREPVKCIKQINTFFECIANKFNYFFSLTPDLITLQISMH